MDLMMNGLLIAATLFAGGYCWVLARRVQDLKSLDRGLGGSIVSLTRQVELARLTLDEARSASKETRQDLGQLVGRADTAARELRLLIAAAPVMPAPRTVEPAPVAEALPLVAVAPQPPDPFAPDPVEMPGLTDVPKPRALLPVENPLRRAKVAGSGGPAHSEDEILEALKALAGGAR